jgi:hypothetical protein
MRRPRARPVRRRAGRTAGRREPVTHPSRWSTGCPTARGPTGGVAVRPGAGGAIVVDRSAGRSSWPQPRAVRQAWCRRRPGSVRSSMPSARSLRPSLVDPGDLVRSSAGAGSVSGRVGGTRQADARAKAAGARRCRSNREITCSRITVETQRTHMVNILAKPAHSAAGAVIAVRHGIVSVECLHIPRSR